MDRRAFVAGSAALLATPPGAEAQGRRKVHRIGVLGLSPTSAAMAGPDPQNKFVNAFVRGMRELGYTYGEHYVTETRGAEGTPERYARLVADLVGLKVDVIVSAEAGLLMSYGVSLPHVTQRIAALVDKILKGARPGDPPFEDPTQFELVINLKTAKALSLTIPPSLLARADQVIE